VRKRNENIIPRRDISATLRVLSDSRAENTAEMNSRKSSPKNGRPQDARPPSRSFLREESLTPETL